MVTGGMRARETIAKRVSLKRPCSNEAALSIREFAKLKLQLQDTRIRSFDQLAILRKIRKDQEMWRQANSVLIMQVPGRFLVNLGRRRALSGG